MENKKEIQMNGAPKVDQLSFIERDGKVSRNGSGSSGSVSALDWASRPNHFNQPDLVCFSHLRWDFVYQRPQHLMNRFACNRRVFFVEESVFSDGPQRLEISHRDCGVWVVVPYLPHGLSEEEIATAQQTLLIDDLFLDHQVNEYILWYYTPMALSFTSHLEPLALVYDCMDELSAFKNAPVKLKEQEKELLKRADLVFTGGVSLYEAKRHLHSSTYPFPSSIDASHFQKARHIKQDPSDQTAIAWPRIGFCGVIDERMDMELIRAIAEARPDWQLVMVGPVVKIDPADLPKRENIHYLGSKRYEELPAYMSGWDIAMLPFAHNESTRFISPTKTPEYLAAGVPVISTSIQDVVRPYGQQGLVRIADTVDDFVAAVEYFFGRDFERESWLRRVDEVLAYNSWDRTWSRMMQMLNSVVSSRYPASHAPTVHPSSSRDAHRVVSSSTSGD